MQSTNNPKQSNRLILNSIFRLDLFPQTLHFIELPNAATWGAKSLAKIRNEVTQAKLYASHHNCLDTY
jgi:hypothetical protein